MAMDWACKKLPTYERSEIKKLFDNMPTDLDGKKAPVWQSYIESLMDSEKTETKLDQPQTLAM